MNLVLYGTLRRGEPNFELLELEDRLTFIRQVTFPGLMYDLGDYPAVVRSATGGTVVGELFALADESVLALLDDFELFRPEDAAPYDRDTERGSLYLRETIRIDEGQAYVYLFNDPGGTLRTRPLIRSGDWLLHIASR